MQLPTIITDIIENFSRLPGIGHKTASRYVLSMANWGSEDIRNFGEAVLKLNEIRNCTKCGMFSENEICSICASNRKSSGLMCVVENISDLMAIENSEQFYGTYHILGGVLNPLMGVGPDELKISLLLDRVQEEAVTNIVLAINPSVEGDATCSYINKVLPENVSVERIGFGIPMGGSLEYLDAMTIGKALENKKKL